MDTKQKTTTRRRGTLKGRTGDQRGAPSRNVRRSRSRERLERREGGRLEFEQKVIAIRRVARVVAGGRRFSFSAAIVLGDRNGLVGVGIGKGQDTAVALDKAVRHAKKNAIKVPIGKFGSIPHEVTAKYCSSTIFLAPAPGRGLVAGSSARAVLNLAGLTDVTAKVLSRSKNKLNNAQATIKALRALAHN